MSLVHCRSLCDGEKSKVRGIKIDQFRAEGCPQMSIAKRGEKRAINPDDFGKISGIFSPTG